MYKHFYYFVFYTSKNVREEEENNLAQMKQLFFHCSSIRNLYDSSAFFIFHTFRNVVENFIA